MSLATEREQNHGAIPGFALSMFYLGMMFAISNSDTKI